MKNKILLISIAVIILAVAGFFIFFQETSNAPTNLPSGESANFNLIFKYGVGAKNELNTFDQTYTKDMVMDPSVTIKFKLTDSELVNLRQKIEDLKLFDKDEKLAEGETGMMRTPCSSYYLKVQKDSVSEELPWDDCQGKISDKLQQFIDYVIPIIESKEEYKNLPVPKGGYL